MAYLLSENTPENFKLCLIIYRNNLTMKRVLFIAIASLLMFSFYSCEGEQGEQGEQGETGAQGEQGVQGVKGDEGEAGEKGDTGDDGNANVYIIEKIVQPMDWIRGDSTHTVYFSVEELTNNHIVLGFVQSITTPNYFTALPMDKSSNSQYFKIKCFFKPGTIGIEFKAYFYGSTMVMEPGNFTNPNFTFKFIIVEAQDMASMSGKIDVNNLFEVLEYYGK